MTDIAGQLVPVASALAGVGLTLAGSALTDRYRWRRERWHERQARSLLAFVDLLQSITDIGRTLRQTAEQLQEGRPVDLHQVARVVDDLIGQARRQGTVVRLVGPRDLFELIIELEDQMGPIYRIMMEVDRSGNSEELVEPARRLFGLRDAFVDRLRVIAGLS